MHDDGLRRRPRLARTQELHGRTRLDDRIFDAASAIIDRACVDVGLRPALRVLANIESPKGLRNAVEIVSHPRVAGLQLGYADLFGPFSIERHVYSVMFAVRMAAEAEVFRLRRRVSRH